MSLYRILRSVSFIALASAGGSTAYAASMATSVTAGATNYDAGFFATFSPTSALDIAARVPGFSLEESNNDLRGFGGSAGNVVFNGARPSSKSELLSTILARIPAKRVVRVEVAPGSLYGSDYASRSQVLNIVMSEDGGIDGNVTATLSRQWTGPIVPNFSASAIIKRGDSSFNLSAGTGIDDRIDEGTDKLTDLDSGLLFEKRRKENHYRPRGPYVSAGWSLEQASDRAIHLNGRFQRFSEDFEQFNQVYPVGGDPRRDSLFMVAKSPGYEIGGDISRPFAGGTAKLVALTNRRHRNNLDTVLVRNGDETVGGYEQGSESQRNETVGKVSWSKANLAGFSFEMGGEAALNTLDYNLDLYVLGAGGARDRIDLPLDNATVSERRAEFYVKAGKQLSKAVRLDAGLNYELSQLKVRGDTTADRSLKFLKPSLTLDIKPGDDWHAQLIARRTVAQLDFFDFISAAELSNDRVNGGNANLQPQRAWEFRVSVDHPLFKTGLIKLDVGYDRISLLQDRILTEDGFDAPGNIGTGTRAFASLNVDAPLDSFGVKGTRLRLFGQVQHTKVSDPISNDTRGFSGFYPDWQWSAELRRDAGKLAYGLSLNDRDGFSYFRSNEIDTNYNDGIYGSAFVEYRPSNRSTVTLRADNMFNTRGLRDRLFTFPNRSFADPSANEFRERNSHMTLSLQLKRSFGSSADKQAPA